MSSTTLSPCLHSVDDALRLVREGLTALRAANFWCLSDAEMLDVRAQLEPVASGVSAAKLRATREIDARGAAVAVGATSTVDWLIGTQRLHPGEAGREVRLAAAIHGNLPATAEALASGAINTSAAMVIADTDTRLAKTATAAERAEAETLLVEQAQILDVRRLQAAALHLRHVLDPDWGDRIADEEEEQVARREFKLVSRPDGSSRPDGYLDKEATEFLRAALDPLAKPRPEGGAPDRRSAAQRTGDALIELVEIALRSGELPQHAGQPVQIVVSIDLEDLRRRAQGHPGSFADGLPVSAEAVRRLACDCQVVPVVLGTHGEPLDVGRAARTAPASLRRALEIRDGGCAFPGCTRPPRWCQVHHIDHWAEGGETSCANCVLLCGVHHRSVHHHGWSVRTGGDGLPEFQPPAWIDPERRPRRNIRVTRPGRGSWWRPRRT